jgi:hypothetical protein
MNNCACGHSRNEHSEAGSHHCNALIVPEGLTKPFPEQVMSLGAHHICPCSSFEELSIVTLASQ